MPVVAAGARAVATAAPFAEQTLCAVSASILEDDSVVYLAIEWVQVLCKDRKVLARTVRIGF